MRILLFAIIFLNIPMVFADYRNSISLQPGESHSMRDGYHGYVTVRCEEPDRRLTICECVHNGMMFGEVVGERGQSMDDLCQDIMNFSRAYNCAKVQPE